MNKAIKILGVVFILCFFSILFVESQGRLGPNSRVQLIFNGTNAINNEFTTNAPGTAFTTASKIAFSGDTTNLGKIYLLDQGTYITDDGGGNFLFNTGAVIPNTATCDLGSVANIWRDLYISSGINTSLTTPSIIFLTNNTAANGSLYLDTNGICWKRTNSTWIVR